MKPAHSLESVERAAKGMAPVSLLIHYADREEPVRYPWNERTKIRWDNVRRVRIDEASPRWRKVGNGDTTRIDGRRVRGIGR
jgi:hypothetical protein